jgi:hydrogenase maturation protease
LILGYGNPDREDDGAAWHILVGLAQRLGRPAPDSYAEGFDESGLEPELIFTLQLTPELAETLAGYDRVCLIDAHTGAVPEDVHVENIAARFQSSPLTHHMTPQTLISLVETLYQRRPEAILVSVRGYQFEFVPRLSDRTAALAKQAEDKIWEWLHQE